ncbi:MAG TPA: SIMPL domain-containing protein, partial [Candidatus Paceibacterota bacterium]|nr:SIMPL domain-containing protein [Candidatus Paceibacterota bacterium]
MDKEMQCGNCPMCKMGMGGMHKYAGCVKKLFALAVFLMFLSFAYSAFIYAGAYADSIQPGSYRSFSVSGEGKVTAVPDIASFTFSVITEGGKDLGALQKENTEKMNKAIEFIKGKDVESKDIKTSNYSLNPRYQYFDCARPLTSSVQPCPPPEIVGYTINQTVSVKIRDFSKIGEIMSGVVAVGANNVSQLSFGIDDQTMVEAGARSEAIM